MSGASAMRARSLLRRYAVATVLLGLFAGASGGVAMGAWGIARRTATVFDRFVAYEDAATVGVFACYEDAPDLTSENFLEVCSGYDYGDVAGLLESTPGVEAVGRVTAALVEIAPAGRPEAAEPSVMPFAIDVGAADVLGRPIIVDGRLADPDDASEVVVNEAAALRFGVGVGDELIITPFTEAQFDAVSEGSANPAGLKTVTVVTGIIRRTGDLVSRLGGETDSDDEANVVPGPAWWMLIDGDVARYGVELLVKTSGNDAVVSEALMQRWPDRTMFVDAVTVGDDGSRTVVSTIGLQALGGRVIAGVLALAALVFAGQAVVRQSRREWDDAPTLDALGMDRRTMVQAAMLRGLAVAGVAVTAAAAVAIGLSPFGPIGIGRAAEPAPGVRIDPVVLAVGLPLLALAVVLGAVWPVARLRLRPSADTSPHVAPFDRRVPLPVAGTAGWAMLMSRRVGGATVVSAVVGVVLAAAAAIATLTIAQSYDGLVGEPARYGAHWDVVVGNVASAEQQEQTQAALRSIDGIRAVGIRSLDGINDDGQAVIVAAQPFIGEVVFGEITAGRAPLADNEIALGRRTMEDLGTEIGGVATIDNNLDPPNTIDFEVVGTVTVNDALSAAPGRGALVTDSFIERVAADEISQNYAVWIDPGVDRDAVLDQLQQAFPLSFDEPRPPLQVSNLGLVAGQPVWVAVAVGAFACIALTHALFSSVRRSRRQIGVLRSLGFTTGEVVASVAWFASLLAVFALIVGVPLGIVAGRLSWTAIVDDIGVVSAPVVPVASVLFVVVLVLAVANVAALAPGWVAARTRPADALRTE